jgi:hypothetical protein
MSVTVALVALLGLGAGSALASYEKIASFPVPESTSGVSIAMDQSLHVVYVVSGKTAEANQIFKFNEKGEPQEFAAAKSDAVVVSGPEEGYPSPGVAVDNSSNATTHDIYVTLPASNEVVALNDEGTITHRIKGMADPAGVAVNGAGDVFVSQYAEGSVLEISPSGELLNNGKPVVENLTHPASLAFNSAGDLYVAEDEKAAVEFVANGQGGFEPAKTISTVTHVLAHVNVDQSTNDVFIGEAGGNTQEFSEQGTKIGEAFELGTGDIAVDETSNAIYVALYKSNLVNVFAPAVPKQTLTVKRTGTGEGTVTSEPSGIACGVTCSAEFAEGKEVELKETPKGSTFKGWSGGGCSGTGTCKVTMSAATEVTAEFEVLPTFLLTVKKTGSGGGTVTSTPGGIDCGATCSFAFPEGEKVTLTETPEGSTFAGWSGGGCSGTGTTCNVTVSAATEVTAEFTKLTTVELAVAITGEGEVTSSPAGIECGLTKVKCTEAFTPGTVTLTAAKAGVGYEFAGWIGCKKTTATACEVNLIAASEVTAVFLKAGLTGPIGPQGPAGSTGATGSTGPGGATGAIGPKGANGEPGANGAAGAKGASGANGAAGAQGPAGPAGPAGKEGPAGKVEVVTCTKSGKKKKCTTKTVSGTVKFTTSSMHATLVRHGLVYATGAAVTGAHGRLGLRLSALRSLRPGRYTLTLISGSGRDERIRTEAFTLS